MIAGHHGLRLDMRELRRSSGVSSRGTNLRILKELANELQLDARALKVDIQALANIQLPAILHWNMTHYVVLDQINKREFVVLDPNLGKRKLTFDEVSQAYTGVCLELIPRLDFKPSGSLPKKNNTLPMLGKISGIKKTASLLITLGILIQVVSLASPYYLQWIIDEALPTEDAMLVTGLAAMFGILLLLQLALTASRSWITTALATKLKFGWFGNVFSHVLRLPLEYFERRGLGDVNSRFASVEQIQHALSTTFIESIMDGILVIIVLGLMASYSGTLTLVSLGTVAIYAAIRWATFPILETATRDQIAYAAVQNSKFLETIRGIQTIRLFQRASQRWSDWVNTLAEQFNKELNIARLKLGYLSTSSAVFGVERVLLIWLGAGMVLDKRFTVGMLIAFIGYKEQFSDRISRLIDAINEFRVLRVQIDRLADIAETPDEPSSSRDQEIELLRPTLELSKITFRYGANERDVLRDVNMTIPFGQCVCITGPSGGGKSTLMRILITLLTPTSGAISVDGVPATRLGLENYRSLFGVVMQDDFLFAGTIADNIHFFDSEADVTRVHRSAALAGIHDEISRMPMGYRTLIGDLGSGLSGGQKQRIFLARALYKEPKILVLDEATSHLDIDNEALVNSSVRKLSLTRIIVAHRPQTIASADRIIQIRDGRIVSDEPNRACSEEHSEEHCGRAYAGESSSDAIA